MPASKKTVQTPVARPTDKAVFQIQFAPKAGAAVNAIVPPRKSELDDRSAQTKNIFLPSPPKPYRPSTSPSIQQAAIAPNVGKSAKASVLRTAPSPDNQLVELVETAADTALRLMQQRSGASHDVPASTQPGQQQLPPSTATRDASY